MEGYVDIILVSSDVEGEDYDYVIIEDLGEKDFNEDQLDYLVSVDSFYGLDESASSKAITY